MKFTSIQAIFVAEFCERFAYYGSVFLLPGLLSDVFGTSQSLSTAVLNLVFALSPLASVGVCLTADHGVGKTKVLIWGSVVYSLGLLLLSVAVAPFSFNKFPGDPSTLSWALFSTGIAFLSIGYGVYKAVTAPIVADGLDHHDVPDLARAKYFNIYSWVINIGGLAATLLTPYVVKTVATDGVDVGYYWSFAICTAASGFGFLSIVVNWATLKHVEPCSRTRCQVEKFTLVDFITKKRTLSLLEKRQLASACTTFIPLPFYWLIQNQFMSNVYFQVQWSDIPAVLPDQVFNNVNTIAMLVGILALQQWYALRRQIPTQRSRMLFGFSIVGVAMLFCATVQRSIDARGSFAEDGDYNLRPGAKMVSAGLFVPVYCVSGLASALIDPTTLEAAFRLAPRTWKSVVMTVYLLAASLSGFLGLAFAPLADPSTLTVMYLSMGVILGVVSLMWCLVPAPELDTAVTSKTEVA